MNALSLDLRHRIVACVEKGVSKCEVSRRFGVSRSTVHRLLTQHQQSGTLEARPRPGATRRISVEQEEQLKAQMRAHRNASLDEHCRLWQQRTGQVVSPSTFWRTLKRLNWSFKKRVFMPVNETKASETPGVTA